MGKQTKDFYASRSYSWWKVAIAMIGSCMSGVTFVSVPGMVGSVGFGYLQMCLGFFLGYLVIAFVLTPLYFRLGVVSVYEYLDKRFGVASHKSGAWFFFISKITGASVRLYLMIATIQLLVAGPAGVPFWVTVLTVMLLEWLYTVRRGVRAVIWLDIVKTVTMILAVVLCLILTGRECGTPDASLMRVFYFDDINHPQFFPKQLLGGLFTVIATTGLDQDLMQRTLACKNVRDSQINLIVSSVLQTVVIALFLLLGVFLWQFAGAHGIQITKGDELFPAVAWSGLLPAAGLIPALFIIGLIMAGFPAGGSALTALTTSFTVDILGSDKQRTLVHSVMAILMAASILVFSALNSTSVIDAVYRLASYTYGPILGLFSFGLICKTPVNDKWVPLVAIAAPLLCLVLDLNSEAWFSGYRFSYEILPLNGLFTMAGLWLIRRRS